jgi:hypothetical protein
MAFSYGNEIDMYRGNQNRNCGRYTQTLFGQSIQENPVPVWTTNKEHKPFVVFQDPKSRKMIGISKDKLAYGTLIVGDPGGGKTNLINMPVNRLLATLGSNDVLIIFDPKGDYYREFWNVIPEKARIVIGAGQEYSTVTSYHNSFAEIMPRGNNGKLVYTTDSDADALELAERLYTKMQSETQPIFPAMAEQIIQGLLVYFMRTYWRTDQSKLNNKDFIRFVTGATNEEFKAIFELDYMEDFHDCVNYISGKGNQTQGVNSYISSVLRKLFIGPFARNDPEKEFSMREIVTRPGSKVVFIEYDMRRGESLTPMYGLLLDSALSNALGGRETDRKNVYFILDEMLLLPELKHLSNGLNFGRSQAVKILCGLQNVSGLADAYGETGMKRILASFQNIITFRSSDHDTRQFLIERMGSNYQNLSFSAQQQNINVQREGHTVEEWDIMSLGLGEAIVSLKDESPFFFTMPKYR